jgi:hypothetical protein
MSPSPQSNKTIHRKRRIKNITVISIGILFVIIGVVHWNWQSEHVMLLEGDGIIDTAVIIKTISSKGGMSYMYIFEINNKKYHGFCSVYSYNFSVGDKILIKYLPEYPNEISKPIAEGDSSLILHK